MSGFLIWFVRNPMFCLAGIAIAMAAAQIIPWGLGLSTVCVTALAGDCAHHLSRKFQSRSERRAARKLAEVTPEVRVTSFRDWLNEKERPDIAA